MQIILWIVSGLFGGSSMLAAISQLPKSTQKWTHILMACGGVLLVAAIVCNVLAVKIDWLPALLGSGLICAAAICNGIKGGSFHWQHHVIRIIISVALEIGFILL